MNKTITINIAGIVFHIDETAYELLRNYLASIRSYFAGSEGRDEIIADIESRIAEMFQARLNETKQVILMADVEQVIGVMGKPEDFGDAGEQQPSAAFSPGAYEIPAKKRLFRDPDDKILGGVCSGISAYLDLDPIWLRLIFVMSFFIFGSGLLLYIVLWIIIPSARTTAEKLQMRGEKVNIENIERSIKEEIEAMKSRFQGFASEARNAGKSGYASSVRGFTGKLVDLIGQIAVVFLQVLVKIISVLFILVGLVVLVAVLSVVTGLGDFDGIPLQEVYRGFFDSQGQETLTRISIALLIGIPFFALLYKGVRMLFNVKVKSRTAGLVFMVLWFIGLITGMIAASQVGRNFSQRQSIRKTLPIIQPAGKTLYIESQDTTNIGFYNVSVNNRRMSSDNLADLLRIGSVKLDIVRGDRQFELQQISMARGKTRREALENAEDISYSFSQKDSVLTLTPMINLNRQDKFRNQKVKLILKVPVGNEIYLSHTLEGIIYDIDNVSDTYDDDMLAHRWVMTETGLACMDCDEYDYSDRKRHRHRHYRDEDRY